VVATPEAKRPSSTGVAREFVRLRKRRPSASLRHLQRALLPQQNTRPVQRGGVEVMAVERPAGRPLRGRLPRDRRSRATKLRDELGGSSRSRPARRPRSPGASRLGPPHSGRGLTPVGQRRQARGTIAVAGSSTPLRIAADTFSSAARLLRQAGLETDVSLSLGSRSRTAPSVA
jgi:hypothetical protein